MTTKIHQSDQETGDVSKALDVLRNLGSVAELQRLAAAGCAPKGRPKLNLHVHLPPNFSAFQNIEQALDLAAEQDVRILCASNYYDYGVYGPFSAGARQRNIFPLFGTEIIVLDDELVREGVRVNDPGNPGKMYLCGKGIVRFEPLSARARELLDLIRRNDETRMDEMVAKLADVFRQRGLDTGLTTQTLKEMVVRRHGCAIGAVVLQERHVAQAFQEALFAKVPPKERAEALGRLLGTGYSGPPEDFVKVQGEIRTHLMKAGRPAFAPERFVTFAQARELIGQLGGIPCYPTLADGTRPICEYEEPVEKLIDNLRDLKIACAELIPIRNEPDVLVTYVKKMRSAGIIVCGGTEHNTLDLLPIEPTCVKGKPVPEEVKDIFWEGACVVAAHQFLTAHGQCGFVDDQGRLNPKFDDPERRIDTLARLGAAVIQRFFETGQ